MIVAMQWYFLSYIFFGSSMIKPSEACIQAESKHSTAQTRAGVHNRRPPTGKAPAGADPVGVGGGGGVVLVVRNPPPFWGTPKLHKEGKKVVRVHAKTPRFSN